jgi:hypothetical protein
MKFSDWASKKNKNVVLETLFKVFNSKGFLEEIIKEQDEFDDEGPVEVPNPFTGGEDEDPVNTKEKISNIDRKIMRDRRIADAERARKEAIKRKRSEKRKEILSGLVSAGKIDSPDDILRDAKDKMLLLRYKGMYERKKRIEEIKKLNLDQNIKRIFDLLIELDYLKPEGVKGAPTGGDNLGDIKPERLNKALEEAKSESGNEYPEVLDQLLSSKNLDQFRKEAKDALYKVFDYPVRVPYDEDTDHAVDKIIKSIGKRHVTSFVLSKKDMKNLLKAKEWNWPWLMSSGDIDPQEIKNELSRRLGSAAKTKKIDTSRRKEKTTGQMDSSSEVDMDPTKLIRSRERTPQMSVGEMERAERIGSIRDSIRNVFKELHTSNPDHFAVFATALGLEYDQLGNVDIPEDATPLLKNTINFKFNKDLVLQKLKEKGFTPRIGKELSDQELGSIIRKSNEFIRRRLTDEKSPWNLKNLGLRTLRPESVSFSDWLFINN